MELLLDAGEGGTLRGLCGEGGDVGTVCVPEGLTVAPIADASDAVRNDEAAERVKFLARRLALMGRTAAPARGHVGPR